jgi:hypothetical protein
MVLHGRSLAIELVVDGERELALLGAVEAAGSGRADGGSTQADALGQTGKTAHGEHGGRAGNGGVARVRIA